MKIITGPAVEGDNYYYRKYLVDKAWELIESGSHILITAPRRVGKTSLMFYLRNNPKKDHYFVYLDTESVNNENEFYQRLVNKILKTDLVKKSQKVLTYLKKNIPSIKNIGPNGVEFEQSKKKNFREILIPIIESIQCNDSKLIIMLDEFPQTISNIVEKEGENAGRHFLQSNRELRQDTESNKNVQFIYAGSIGLENIVSRLNAVGTINDLAILRISPLTKNEANDLMDLLLENTDYDLSQKMRSYILKKIEWLIPFYVQLVISELKEIYREEKTKKITEKIVNRAFEDMIKQRNYFEHWHTRLRNFFKGKEYKFVKDVLNTISYNATIKSNDIFDTSVKYELKDSYNDLLNVLIYDGYINNNDDSEIYRFNSPILRMCWEKYVGK